MARSGVGSRIVYLMVRLIIDKAMQFIRSTDMSLAEQPEQLKNKKHVYNIIFQSLSYISVKVYPYGLSDRKNSQFC